MRLATILIRVAILAAIAGAVGTMSATSITCGVGLLSGTNTWCGVGFIWLMAIPIAVTVSLVAGPPCHWLFQRVGLKRWWQFVLCGLIVALPFWYQLAQPFSSDRWNAVGTFDTLNYLGSGAAAGLFYWLFTMSDRNKNAL